MNPVTLRKSVPYHAVIDTGCDSTIIPLSMLEQLDLQPLRHERVRGLWGGGKVVKVFTLTVIINNVMFNRIEAVGTTEELTILIGRDITNQLQLLIDGPSLTVEILP